MNMIVKDQQRAAAILTGGLILIGLSPSYAETILAPCMLIGGYISYILACMFFAQSKGYSRKLGCILGVIVVGILALFFLKDKTEGKDWDEPFDLEEGPPPDQWR